MKASIKTRTVIAKDGRVSQRIPVSLDRKLKQASSLLGLRRSVIVRSALEEFVANVCRESETEANNQSA